MEQDTQQQPQQETGEEPQQEPRRRKLWEWLEFRWRKFRDWLGYGEKGGKTNLDLIYVLAVISVPIAVGVGGGWV